MKKKHFLLIFTLVSLFALLRINAQQLSASAAERFLPRISLEKTVFELGEVGQGTKNTCEFRFTNTGSADGGLKIGNISRTCPPKAGTVFHLDKKQYLLSTPAFTPR